MTHVVIERYHATWDRDQESMHWRTIRVKMFQGSEVGLMPFYGVYDDTMRPSRQLDLSI